MKLRTALLLTFLILALSSATALAQNWQWTQREGGAGYDLGNAICTDNFGNCYVASSIAVSRYNPMGVMIWRDSLPPGTRAVNLCWAYDRLYVLCCSTMSTLFIQPYDLTGTQYPSFYSATGLSGVIEADGAGNLVIGASASAFLNKIDTTGAAVWSISAPAATTDLDFDVDGNIYITGRIYNDVTLGTTTLTCEGTDDILVAKYDSSGNCIWASDAGRNNTVNPVFKDQGNGIAVDDSGNIYVTGQYADTFMVGNFVHYSAFPQDNELFLAKWDNNGNFIWVQSGGGWFDQVGTGLVLLSQNRIAVSGMYVPEMYVQSAQINGWGDYDACVVLFDSSGNFLSALTAGGSVWNDMCNGIAIDGGGNIFTCGSFSSVAYFGSDSLISSANYDVFVARIDFLAGTNELALNSTVSVYPNPCTNEIWFDFANNVAQKQIVFYDAAGRGVKTVATSESRTAIPVADLPAGVYFYHVRLNEMEETNGKFIRL